MIVCRRWLATLRPKQTLQSKKKELNKKNLIQFSFHSAPILTLKYEDLVHLNLKACNGSLHFYLPKYSSKILQWDSNRNLNSRPIDRQQFDQMAFIVFIICPFTAMINCTIV